MNYNQSIVKNLLKSTLESERLTLLSELKLVHSADRLFYIFTTDDIQIEAFVYGCHLRCVIVC